MLTTWRSQREPKCNVTEVIRELRASKELRKNEMDADFWIESMERDVEYRRLQEELQNQIIDTNPNPSKISVTVSRFTLSVESEVSTQTSESEKTNKISFEQEAIYNPFQGVDCQPPTTNKNERQNLVQGYLMRKMRTYAKFINNNLNTGITQYVNHNQGFLANQCLAHKGFKVTKMRFMTAEKQISGISITSELVMAKNEDSITGDFKSQLLPLGDLKGNHFNIALRNVIGDQCHIETCLHSLGELGFLNFFCPEFGLGNSHLIGKELLLERWQEAIDSIIEPLLMCKKPSNLALACFEYKSSRDASKAVKISKKKMASNIPSRLLFSIEQHGENLAEALQEVPFESRKSYVHAYLGFTWNKIVSKRIKKFGLKLIMGDLVYDPQHNQVIFIDNGNIHKYAIYDVVLPLPGPDTLKPANEIAEWYEDFLKADELTEKNLNRNSKIYGLDGVYRFMIIRPSDLKWKFVRYNGKRPNLLCSDSERLSVPRHPPVNVKDGEYLGLVLEFDLPTFSFASMALREMLKRDITNTYEENQLDRSLKRPLAANEIIINQPQIQKTDENSCRITAPTPETNNFFLGSRAASATSELCQASPLRKINLESDTVEKPSSTNSSVEQPTPCPSSNSESQLNLSLEQPVTIDNLPSSSREKFKQFKAKWEQENFKHSSTTTKDSSEELQKNRMVLERSTSNQMNQLTVNECINESQTKCVKEEPGISRTRKSSLSESCAEEPAGKKIKTDPDAKQKEFPSKVSSFKCIIYIDLSSDEEN